MTIAGDQVVRREQFERQHPEILIAHCIDHWQALVPGDGGETVVCRFELHDLLDRLEELAGAR
jgi:hypothetical protein